MEITIKVTVVDWRDNPVGERREKIIEAIAATAASAIRGEEDEQDVVARVEITTD